VQFCPGLILPFKPLQVRPVKIWRLPGWLSHEIIIEVHNINVLRARLGVTLESFKEKFRHPN
jgi:hypothetical protein